MPSDAARERLQKWGRKLHNSGLAPWLALAIEGVRPLLDAAGAAFAGVHFLLSPWADKEIIEALDALFADPQARADFLSALNSPNGKK